MRLIDVDFACEGEAGLVVVVGAGTGDCDCRLVPA
jgi:hypothetical protein